MSILVVCWFLFLSYAAEGDHLNSGVVLKPINPPPVVTSLDDYAEGNDECLRTSYYYRPQDEFVCKNLGKCYQYHCRKVAARCGSCAGGNGPCIKYDLPVGGQSSKVVRKSKRLKRRKRRADKAWNKLLRMYGKKSKNRRSAETRQVPPIYIENIGNAIVHLNTSDKNCSGFVTSLLQEKHSYVIITAAQCLVRYEVACEDTYEWRQRDRSFNDSVSCFRDLDLDVNKVIKQFRSYVVSITSYSGKRYTLPLNSATVFIPRNFLECNDCRFDVAALKINPEVVGDILGRSGAFVLGDEKKSSLLSTPVAMVAVSDGFPSDLLRRASRIKFCTINHVTKQKMCVEIPVLVDQAPNEEYLPGSPIFMLPTEANEAIKVVGIHTGFDSLTNKTSQPHGAENERFSATSQIDGAVRITSQFKTALTNFMSETSQMNAVMKSARHDCFPSLSKSLNKNSLLCLCSRGWRDEMNDCTNIDAARLPAGCSFDATTGRLWCRRKPTTREGSHLMFQDSVIPGNVSTVDLRFQNIHDDVEVAEVLRHLQLVKRVILEYNSVQILSDDIFDNNGKMEMLSLKNNQISTVSSDMLRRNYNITSVSLANNLIEEIPEDLFRYSSKIRILNLQNNRITRLGEDTFSKNPLLTRILLRNNRLSQLPSGLFHHNTKLQELWLDHNQLTTIPEDLFQNCGKLLLINLSFNKLTTLSPPTFQNCISLRYVDLSYNKLTSLHPDLFQNITTIQSVNTVGNPLV